MSGYFRASPFRNRLLYIVCLSGMVPILIMTFVTQNNVLNCMYRVNCDNTSSWETRAPEWISWVNTAGKKSEVFDSNERVGIF